MVANRPDAQDNSSDDLRIILHDVSWDTYQRLLAERPVSRPPRFAYDRGTLEIARLPAPHAFTVRALANIVTIASDELRVPISDRGSTTCTLSDRRLGFEPDSSFALHCSPRIHGIDYVDRSGDPPPDVIIEVNVAGPSLDKLPIYAAFGVPEVWRYEAVTDRVLILRLREGAYRQRRESAALVPLTSDMLTQLVHDSRVQPSFAWLREFESWLRTYD